MFVRGGLALLCHGGGGPIGVKHGQRRVLRLRHAHLPLLSPREPHEQKRQACVNTARDTARAETVMMSCRNSAYGNLSLAQHQLDPSGRVIVTLTSSLVAGCDLDPSSSLGISSSSWALGGGGAWWGGPA
jgi:hypothetical protein